LISGAVIKFEGYRSGSKLARGCHSLKGAFGGSKAYYKNV